MGWGVVVAWVVVVVVVEAGGVCTNELSIMLPMELLPSSSCSSMTVWMGALVILQGGQVQG